MQDIITAIQPFATKRAYKKHSILLYQGEAPRSAFVLLSGVIKAYSINAAGEEQIAAFEVAKDIFPTPWIFGKASSTLYYYEALSDCEVLTVPREQLRKAIDSTPRLQAQVMNYFISMHTSMTLRVTALEQSRAREKIMFTLYYLLSRYGKEIKPNIFRVELSLTHGTIASLVGLTRETTTTELSKLRREKVLTYTAHDYTIDKTKLERLLGEDSFRDLSL
jgi:CRP/FNR family transcriptional regulator